MSVTDYKKAVKRALRDQHGFEPQDGSTDEEPILKVPDGDYPVTINERLDKVFVSNGYINCLNFD